MVIQTWATVNLCSLKTSIHALSLLVVVSLLLLLLSLLNYYYYFLQLAPNFTA